MFYLRQGGVFNLFLYSPYDPTVECMTLFTNVYIPRLSAFYTTYTWRNDKTHKGGKRSMSYPRGLPTKVLLYNFSHKSDETENKRDDKQCTASLYNIP